MSPRSWRVALVAVLGSGCLVPELTLIPAGDAGPDGGGSGGEGASPTCTDLFPARWSQACRDCVAARCCDATEPCARDPACAAAALCIASELSPSVVDRCAEAHAYGVSAYLATAIACVETPDACLRDCEGESWECAGHWEWPEPVESTAFVTVRLLDWTTDLPNVAPEPVVGATVQCSSTNGHCLAPTTGKTGTYGGMTLGVSLPLEGFFEIDAGGFGSSLAYAPEPHGDAETIVDLAPDGLLEGLAALDPAKGHVVVRVTDCTVEPASALTIELAPASGQLFYLDGVQPNLAARATMSSGSAAVLNVDPGKATITARWKGDAVAQTTVEVRAATTTYVSLEPKRQR